MKFDFDRSRITFVAGCPTSGWRYSRNRTSAESSIGPAVPASSAVPNTAGITVEKLSEQNRENWRSVNDSPPVRQ
jgi:hypothetical protein